MATSSFSHYHKTSSNFCDTTAATLCDLQMIQGQSHVPHSGVWLQSILPNQLMVQLTDTVTPRRPPVCSPEFLRLTASNLPTASFYFDTTNNAPSAIADKLDSAQLWCHYP
jgi:hypothetical protein